MRGIDIIIETIKTQFSNRVWIGKTVEFYGRAFDTRYLDLGIVPKAFDSVTKDYKILTLDDRIDGLMFFRVLPNNPFSSGSFTANVQVYFAVNLRALYPAVLERATEHAHNDCLNVLFNTRFNITGLIRGIESFADYGFVEQKDDMNPFYLFRIDGTLIYDFDECN